MLKELEELFSDPLFTRSKEEQGLALRDGDIRDVAIL